MILNKFLHLLFGYKLKFLKALYGCLFEGFLCFYSLNRTILRRLYIRRKLPLSLSLGRRPTLSTLLLLLHCGYLGISGDIHILDLFELSKKLVRQHVPSGELVELGNLQTKFRPAGLLI